MKSTNIINFITHIINMSLSSGRKRIWYALGNILIIGIGFLSALGIARLFSSDLFSNLQWEIFPALLGVVILGAITLYCFFQGLVAQLALFFIALIGIFSKEGRGANIVAFAISLLTLIAVVITLVLFINN